MVVRNLNSRVPDVQHYDRSEIGESSVDVPPGSWSIPCYLIGILYKGMNSFRLLLVTDVLINPLTKQLSYVFQH